MSSLLCFRARPQLMLCFMYEQQSLSIPHTILSSRITACSPISRYSTVTGVCHLLPPSPRRAVCVCNLPLVALFNTFPDQYSNKSGILISQNLSFNKLISKLGRYLHEKPSCTPYKLVALISHQKSWCDTDPWSGTGHPHHPMQTPWSRNLPRSHSTQTLTP